MTETEYDIIDELYFVTAFPELARSVALPDTELINALLHLVDQGYVKCFFPDPDTEIEIREESFKENYLKYFFLATKAGLIAHNSR